MMNKQNKQSRITLPQYQNGGLQEYMQILYDHQKKCQKTGKYLQADAAKKRLIKVKEELQRQRKEDLLYKFDQERKQVEMAHLQQISQFNKYWDQKMLQYQSEAENLQNEILEKHNQQMHQFQSQIEKSLSQGRKQSAQIINLRKIQENLAKQEDYIQAHKVQKRIQVLQKGEIQKWYHLKNNKAKNLIMQLKSKQQSELNALRQKIQLGFEEQKKTRNEQCQKLIQKYQNFMKQLQNQQHQQIIKFQKSSKLQSTVNCSRISNASRSLQIKNN